MVDHDLFDRNNIEHEFLKMQTKIKLRSYLLNFNFPFDQYGVRRIIVWIIKNENNKWEFILKLVKELHRILFDEFEIGKSSTLD